MGILTVCICIAAGTIIGLVTGYCLFGDINEKKETWEKNEFNFRKVFYALDIQPLWHNLSTCKLFRKSTIPYHYLDSTSSRNTSWQI